MMLVRVNGPRLSRGVSHMGNVDYSRSYPAWRRKLSGTGFRLLHQEGFCWAPFGRTSNSSLIPAFTGIEKLLHLNRIPTISPWIAFIARKVAGT